MHEPMPTRQEEKDQNDRRDDRNSDVLLSSRLTFSALPPSPCVGIFSTLCAKHAFVPWLARHIDIAFRIGLCSDANRDRIVPRMYWQALSQASILVNRALKDKTAGSSSLEPTWTGNCAPTPSNARYSNVTLIGTVNAA